MGRGVNALSAKRLMGFLFRAAGLSALILFISGLIPVRAIGACYGDGQPAWGCELAASGWPFAFIHDGGYTSPTDSADWLGLIGSDILQPDLFKNALMLSVILGIFLAAVFQLTRAESADDRRAEYIFKPLSALGFLAIPTLSSLAYTPNMWFLSGLAVCGLGDILLLSRTRPLQFKLGMAAFAVGHLAYVGGLWQWTAHAETKLWAFALSGALVVFSSVKVLRWLRPHLPSDMYIPVIIYSAIIGVMVTLALGSFISAPYLLPMIAAVAAVMFAVSDIYVARDRFVIHEPKNARRITPLYFGAQLLFAILASI